MKPVALSSMVVAAAAAFFVLACSSSDDGSKELPDQGALAIPSPSGPPSSPALGSPTPASGPGTSTASSDVCGNGLDDDGNGQIDEGCPCTPGATQKCFAGNAKLAGVGACVMGMQTCVAGGSAEFKSTTWGPCTGSVAPAAETCNGADDDCNGKVDDISSGTCGPPPPKCQGTGLIFASLGDECIDDGGASAAGDQLEVYCVNDIARFCLSYEACPWRDGTTTPDTVTCSTAGLTSTYFASARDTCGDWQGHPRICCSPSGQVSFSGC